MTNISDKSIPLEYKNKESQNSIQPLHFNAFENFDCESLDIKNFLRFGIPHGGSSFFYAFFSWRKDFRDLSVEDKYSYIVNERQKLIENITDEDIIQETDFLVRFVEMYKMVLILLTNNKLYEPLSNLKKDIIDIIFQLIPIEILQNEMVTNFESVLIDMEQPTKEDFNNHFLSIYKKFINIRIDEIEKNVKEKWSDALRNKIISVLIVEIDIIFDYVFQETISESKETISSVNSWLSVSQLLSVAPTDINVMVIDAVKMCPLEIQMDYDDTKHCIILLYYPDHHYEILGRKYGEKISRLFSYESRIVQNIVKYYD
jgi:hypothetical protein